jgi:hypothetical protein
MAVKPTHDDLLEALSLPCIVHEGLVTYFGVAALQIC